MTTPNNTIDSTDFDATTAFYARNVVLLMHFSFSEFWFP